MKPLGIGVIGVGHMGRMYARLLRDLPETSLVGLYDVDHAAARRVAEEQQTEAFENQESLLAAPDLEAVIIAVPDSHHRRPVEAALAAGKDVMLEKPLATTAEDGQAMIRASTAAGRILFVAHTLRFDPRYAAAQASVASGELGDILHVYARRNSWYDVSHRVAAWSTLPFFLGIHDVDMLHWVLGTRVASVFCRSVRKVFTNNDDTVLASLCMEDGAIGTVELSWALPTAPGSRQSPMLEIVGAKGFVHVTLSEQGVSVHTGNQARHPDFWYSFEPALHGHMLGVYREEILHFWRSLRQGEPLAVTPEEALNAVRVADAMERSLHERREIAIQYP